MQVIVILAQGMRLSAVACRFHYPRIYTYGYVQQNLGAEGALGSSFRAKFETGGEDWPSRPYVRTRDSGTQRFVDRQFMVFDQE